MKGDQACSRVLSGNQDSKPNPAETRTAACYNHRYVIGEIDGVCRSSSPHSAPGMLRDGSVKHGNVKHCMLHCLRNDDVKDMNIYEDMTLG